MSSNIQSYDFVIVGQGLAGSILAHRLINAGQKVLVLDNNHHRSSSKIAAGIINPITGHRFNLTEGFMEFYSIAKRYYQDCESQFGMSIWNELPQARLIKNAGQREYFERRLTQEEYLPLLNEEAHDGNLFSQSPLGIASVSHTAVVNTKNYLQAIQTNLRQSGNLLLKKVDYEEIEVVGGQVRIFDYSASAILFCEGHLATENPWLQKLPFKLSKGEILTVAPEFELEQMLNWGLWLVPEGNFEGEDETGRARLGSNFEWQDLSINPTPAVQKKLMASLRQHTNIEARLVSHEVGIRPTTRDRKPFVGPLQNLQSAYCFNGFGSKGCLLIPYYAELMCEHLLHQKMLPKEVSQWL